MNINVSLIKNNCDAITKETTGLIDLSKLILSDSWSQSVFKYGRRSNKNFLETSLIVLDIDSNCSLSEAIGFFKEHKHIIGTTRNHQVLKNEVKCDRFRVILFLDKIVTDPESYKMTWNEIYKQYPFIDPQCKDVSRFWYPCKEIVSLKDNGCLVSVIDKSSCNTINHNVNTKLERRNDSKNYGEEYLSLIVDVLKEKKLITRKYTHYDLAMILSANITRLRKGTAKLNQEYLARTLNISNRASNNLVKNLVNKEIIEFVSKDYSGGRNPSNLYRLGGAFNGKLYKKERWQSGKANEQMLADIRYCYQQRKSKEETLQYCIQNQGDRGFLKTRNRIQIMKAITNWWDKQEVSS